MPITNRILCTICGSTYHYQSFCPYKKRKPITKRGKRAIEYEVWRDTMAIPYLDKRYGHVCSVKGCNAVTNLDVHHKATRGAHTTSKMQVTNCVYLCRSHHIEVTDGKLKFSTSKKTVSKST